MKRIFIVLLALSPMAHAGGSRVLVQDFNFSYEDPAGRGSAANFSVDSNKESQATVELEKAGEDFKLRVQGARDSEYVLKKAPSLLTKAKTMVVRGMNLSFQESLNLSLESGSFIAPESELNLQKFTVDCARDPSQSNVRDEVLSGCTKKMSLKSSKFISRSFSAEGLVPDVAFGMTGVLASTIGVSGLDLKVVGGKFEFSAELKAQVSGKMKGHGNLSYDPGAKVLAIKIAEIKFSVFNVTARIFDELKKKESEKMKVSKPYVYLTLK